MTSPSYAKALALVGSRRFAEAKTILLEICGARPTALEPWTMLGLCSLAEGKFGELLAMTELRQRQAGDGLKLFHDCLCIALPWPDRSRLREMIVQTPADSALSIIAQYISGLIAALEGDVDRGVGGIINAAQLTAALPPPMAAESYIATIIAEAAILAPFSTMSALEERNHHQLMAAMGTVQTEATMPEHASAAASSEPFIFYSSCDERYLDRFGETAVRALDATGIRTIYHLHVVDPSPATAQKIAHLQTLCSSLALRYSTEVYRCESTGYNRAEYYACSRLVRLPEIFALYGRDVFIWDVDTARVHNIRALTEAMRGHDLGYFRMKNTRLTLVCHLAAVYLTNTPASHRCADLIRNYILAKLPDASFWLLDQAAVYCSSEFLAAGGALRIQDFSACPGGRFTDYVDIASSAAEKQGMRGVAGSRVAA